VAAPQSVVHLVLLPCNVLDRANSKIKPPFSAASRSFICCSTAMGVPGAGVARVVAAELLPRGSRGGELRRPGHLAAAAITDGVAGGSTAEVREKSGLRESRSENQGVAVPFAHQANHSLVQTSSRLLFLQLTFPNPTCPVGMSVTSPASLAHFNHIHLPLTLCSHTLTLRSHALFPTALSPLRTHGWPSCHHQCHSSSHHLSQDALECCGPGQLC